jgi:lipopolysaccharide/colanic/teichoic acid biosynthesis glycosyltransferase
MSMKPGLTCYWQVEDRSDSKDFGRLIAKDLRYIDNWSLWTDLVLILRTIPVAIFGKGAK